MELRIALSFGGYAPRNREDDVQAEQAKASTLIRRHGNKSGMNARCKDPPHSILGSHERALHMLLLDVRCTEHAIPDEPSSCLSGAIYLLV